MRLAAATSSPTEHTLNARLLRPRRGSLGFLIEACDGFPVFGGLTRIGSGTLTAMLSLRILTYSDTVSNNSLDRLSHSSGAIFSARAHRCVQPAMTSCARSESRSHQTGGDR
jgi:hypothetical protein